MGGVPRVALVAARPFPLDLAASGGVASLVVALVIRLGGAWWHAGAASLASAAVAVAAATLSAVWFPATAAVLRWRRAAFSDATHAIVTPLETSLGGAAAVVALGGDGGGARPLEWNRLLLEVSARGEVRRRKMLGEDGPRTARELLARAQRGLGTAAEARAARERYGANAFELPSPAFAELMAEQLTAPFFVFQLFCVLLWCLDEYWYYSLFTLAMLLLFESTMVKQRQRNYEDVREKLELRQQALLALRGGKWARLGPADLLPGDVVSLKPPPAGADEVVPADVLLVSGTCIVNEAMLSGESTPQWKTPASGLDPGHALRVKRDRAHIVFGGTTLLQHSAEREARPRAPDGGCVGLVLRTGFGTSQGKLLRTILFVVDRPTANNRETGLFILFLVCFAVAASAYTLYYALQDPNRSRWKLLLHCIMIVTSVIPPELPMELSVAINASLIALIDRGISCTEPYRIPYAGKVDVCAFDKTGTLTSDDMVFEGVAIQIDSTHKDPPVERHSIPEDAVMVLAACHSIMRLDGQLVGDPVEKAGLAGVGWAVSAAATDCMKPTRSTGHGGGVLRVIHRHHFSPDLRRMSVVVSHAGAEGMATLGLHVLCKGAPEALEPLLREVPAGYSRAHCRLAARGLRVLALATRELPLEGGDAAARKLERSEAESKLRFVGFAAFECPLKLESGPTLKALRAATHALVMITGDASLTACHVARKTGVANRQLLILNAGLEWQTPDGESRGSFSREGVRRLASSHDLCVSGDALASLGDGLLEALAPHVQVYARMTPKQKASVVLTYRALGLTTLMCGDGTNDVAALKASHVGIALLSEGKAVQPARSKVRDGFEAEPSLVARMGDASVAAAFTVRQTNVLPCIDVLRQGRSTLSTTHQMFKILGLNCLVTAYSLSVQSLDGVKLGDTQATFSGLLSAALFMLLSLSKPHPGLAAKRPHSTVFNAYLMGSLVLQFAAHLTLLITCVATVKAASGEGASRPDPDADFSPNGVNTVTYLVSLLLQVLTVGVNYVGEPFTCSLRENTLLSRTLAAGVAAWLVLVLDVVPGLGVYLELVSLPGRVRNVLLLGAGLDLAAVLAVERTLRHTMPAALSPVAESLASSPR